MPQTTIYESHKVECPKCEQTVTFLQEAIHFFDDNDKMYDKSYGGITHDRKCPVAVNAKIPNRPIHSESLNCPIYEALSKRKQ